MPSNYVQSIALGHLQDDTSRYITTLELLINLGQISKRPDLDLWYHDASSSQLDSLHTFFQRADQVSGNFQTSNDNAGNGCLNERSSRRNTDATECTTNAKHFCCVSERLGVPGCDNNCLSSSVGDLADFFDCVWDKFKINEFLGSD